MADEFNITFINKPGNFDNLMEFLSDHINQRFNIKIDTSDYEFDIAKLKVLNKIHPNIYIITTPYKNDFNYFKE